MEIHYDKVPEGARPLYSLDLKDEACVYLGRSMIAFCGKQHDMVLVPLLSRDDSFFIEMFRANRCTRLSVIEVENSVGYLGII